MLKGNNTRSMKRKRWSKLKDCQVFSKWMCSFLPVLLQDKMPLNFTFSQFVEPSFSLSKGCQHGCLQKSLASQSYPCFRRSQYCFSLVATKKFLTFFNAGGEFGSFSWLIFGLWSINSWLDRNNLPSFLGKVRTQLTTYLEKSKTFT